MRIRITMVTIVTALSISALQAAPIVVDSLGDTGSVFEACELRSAITAANTDSAVDGCDAGSGLDTITFSVPGTIVLDSALPDITDDIIIDGGTPDRITINSQETSRPFHFLFSSGIHELRRLTIEEGFHSTFGGCIYNESSGSLTLREVVLFGCTSGVIGGGVLSNGDMNILKSNIRSNNASGGSGGGVYFTGGSSTVTDSTFHDNTAEGSTASGGGLALASGAVVTVSRSTFFDNHADNNGGGLAIFSGESSQLSITSSTISENSCDSDANNSGNGGGIFVTAGNFSLRNTVVSGNRDLSTSAKQPDLVIAAAGTIKSFGNNFIGDNSGSTTNFPTGYPNASSDYVGTSAAPLDAMLQSPYNDFGGPTPVMPPSDDSPLIDLGSCPGELTDQRGFSNPVSGFRIIDMPPVNASDGCDIGSVEWLIELVFDDGFENPEPPEG